MEFIQAAVDTASKSVSHYQHGALIIKKGRVISEGFNRNGSHAEVSAILNTSRVLWGKNDQES